MNLSSFTLTTDGTIKLIDLSFARRMEGSQVFTVVGDPLYFAPEMISQGGYDYAVDLWALGVTLYELFEEKNPFGDAARSETDVFSDITSFQVTDLGFRRTPESCHAVIKELLAANAKQRLGYRKGEDLWKHKAFAATAASPTNGIPLEIDVELDSNAIDALGFSLVQ